MHALNTAIAALTVAAASIGGCSQAQSTSHGRPMAEVLIFCGVDPYDPLAWKQAQALHDVAGATATYGQCLPGDSSYSADEPGVRELDRNGYAKLVEVNAFAGMKTVVYDAGIWSADLVYRQSVIDFWAQPSFYGGRLLDHIYGWNLGDEFNPDSPREWEVLKTRWNIVINEVMPLTGIGPMANQLGNQRTLDQALTDLPLSNIHLAFDMYLDDGGASLARQYNSRAQSLQCAVNALDHWTHGVRLLPTPRGITDKMRELRDEGCDIFLVFGGMVPTGTDQYGTTSLVNAKGKASTWATAIAKGARA